MLDCTEYTRDEGDPHVEFADAKARKLVLKNEGFRVKTIKNADGLFELWKKNVTVISQQRRHGNGRKMMQNDR